VAGVTPGVNDFIDAFIVIFAFVIFASLSVAALTSVWIYVEWAFWGVTR
jgi:hypothetical protein